MQKVLIIGGGLAGNSLGYHLSEKDCDVTLIDSGANESSIIAAGIVNPLVFRRMTKSWRLDEFLPFAVSFYKKIEAETTSSFFHPITIRRFFSSIQEREFWLSRQNTDAFSPYMNIVSEEDLTINPYANKFGSGRVKGSFYIDTINFLGSFQRINKYRIIRKKFNYDALIPETATYEGEQYDFIVFCEGYQLINNPWFNYLPVNPTKGEVLTVKTNKLEETELLNRKCFCLPVGNHQFKIGSTYIWNTTTTDVTKEGRDLLLSNFKFLTDTPVEIIAEGAGVRPTTLDRRPFMGKHPQHNRLAVFNGLGAKGYMMAPLLAKEMADFLIDGKELNRECRIERVKK